MKKFSLLSLVLASTMVVIACGIEEEEQAVETLSSSSPQENDNKNNSNKESPEGQVQQGTTTEAKTNQRSKKSAKKSFYLKTAIHNHETDTLIGGCLIATKEQVRDNSTVEWVNSGDKRYPTYIFQVGSLLEVCEKMNDELKAYLEKHKDRSIQILPPTEATQGLALKAQGKSDNNWLAGLFKGIGQFMTNTMMGTGPTKNTDGNWFGLGTLIGSGEGNIITRFMSSLAGGNAKSMKPTNGGGIIDKLWCTVAVWDWGKDGNCKQSGVSWGTAK